MSGAGHDDNLYIYMKNYYQESDYNFEKIKCVGCPSRQIVFCIFLDEYISEPVDLLDTSKFLNHIYKQSTKRCEAYQWTKLILEVI